MLRMGRSNILYSGTLTWSAGSTNTAAQTLSITVPASAGLTTLIHEIILATNHTASISADIRPVQTVGGSSIYLDIANTLTISGAQTVKGVTVEGTKQIVHGLFNNSSLAICCTLDASASATVTLNCIVQELEGTS